jgi:hypothetical protein
MERNRLTVCNHSSRIVGTLSGVLRAGLHTSRSSECAHQFDRLRESGPVPPTQLVALWDSLVSHGEAGDGISPGGARFFAEVLPVCVVYHA